MTKRSAKKLFKFLDIYETSCDTILAMDSLFQDECEDELKAKTNTAWKHLMRRQYSYFVISRTQSRPIPRKLRFLGVQFIHLLATR
ncbi:hypothetical protein CMV_000338 [Castanea mollissima]|uniref:Exocyst complex subunit Exo70 C-terminal domain-containing protein n=1 Tax=Castanea mollissima TaxID=60419 RepID=A0A8J4RMG5_9ROSI|nr:hypothetical protein CMV_000338 [Castanea mollissima]